MKELVRVFMWVHDQLPKGVDSPGGSQGQDRSEWT